MSTPIPSIPPRRFRPPKDGDEIKWNGQVFRIGQEIGRGTFGVVFECIDEWGNDLVAKIHKPLGCYDEVRGSWLREYQNLAQLRHPNITYIHAAFECEDTFYIIIERCFQTLHDLVEVHGLHGDLWLPYVARDLLHGLHFIHSHGYVHKDLHPGNVFVAEVPRRLDPSSSPEWVFKIGDLGISKLEGDIDPSGTIMAEWMLPPERLDPVQFGPFGKHVDIYHAGLLFLSLLLGRIPRFSNTEIIMGKPRVTAGRLTSPYAPVIAKALRRHVDQRTQSVLELWLEICAVSSSV